MLSTSCYGLSLIRPSISRSHKIERTSKCRHAPHEPLGRASLLVGFSSVPSFWFILLVEVVFGEAALPALEVVEPDEGDWLLWLELDTLLV